MHFHIGFIEFCVFVAYYIILKAFLLVLNLETRRAGVTIPAAVSGLLN
jgi:hypothetical protein